MEGGATVADKAEFKECLRLTWTQPYILQLVLSAGIGGLLFGYDTGVISGALLYIRDDFTAVEKSTVLRETIVSMAVAGAIVGAGFGGWMNDKFGRKPSILIADALFLAGALIMAIAPTPVVIIVGRIFVGLGVGMASMTAPLYISEASPARIRGALVSTNGLLITGGQFMAYLINLAFTRVTGTWRWMLGIAGVPALIQFVLMWMLPESPRWLYRQNRKEEASAILRKIYPATEVEQEIDALRRSVEDEIQLEGSIGEQSLLGKLRKALSSKVVRRGLMAGIIAQVAQQFVGINTVMYYSPTIVQLAGFASNNTAMALSLITSGLNAVGSIVSMFFVDRTGRRRLMLISLVGIVLWLGVLGGTFLGAANHAPPVSQLETQQFANQTQTCPEFSPSVSWNCMNCLKAESTCGFCAHDGNKVINSIGFLVRMSIDLSYSSCLCSSLGRAASPRRMPGGERGVTADLPRRPPGVLHGRVPQQLRLAGVDRARRVHRVLLPRHGHRALDRQLGDIPAAVQGRLRRHRGSGQLGVQPHRDADIPEPHQGARHVGHLLPLLRHLLPGSRRRLLYRAGDQGPAVRGGGEDAREEGLQAVEEILPRRSTKRARNRPCRGMNKKNSVWFLFIWVYVAIICTSL
ncbi:hypothetical protein GUJ93_ZPchr0004g38638 [Zizania palustris]|uniref:Major facilitator superfamily (MFS) profile domain-containing protein n=1 Tax=Zizania palustris TaxID=103762 RepID=A0A8J5S6B4_ZIZPA|nr:hypothetical protein GUJ93_ZPchr0004g38638 [Zizania palustris]KAG8065262.1 hypothetical protein GUJ93_ZPchr0004g38638 [Zizania palustris]KAG8065263.1 hypothetical protein GUJ93_ZPchr0004g38638 [Zizania palustris]